MHLFIDTNIFETDPFWKNSFSKSILEQAKLGKLFLYMSVVVYEELKSHTIKNYKKAQKEYTASVIGLNKYLPKNCGFEAKVDIEKDFVDFYNKLQDDYHLKILPYKNDFFAKVMDRAIKRKKPFSNEKTEVKDCTIWLTYADYVEAKKVTDCYLLTNNSKDFYEKAPLTTDPTEYAIHEELVGDTKRFRGFPSVKDFFKLIVEPQLRATEEFKKWIGEAKVHEEYVFNLVTENETNVIESAINKLVDSWEVDKEFNDNEWFVSGYCQVNEIEWLDCEQVELDILEQSAIVNAIIRLRVSFEGHAYNPAYDEASEKYSYLGEKDVEASVYVSFMLKQEDEYDAFDIDDIEFKEY